MTQNFRRSAVTPVLAVICLIVAATAAVAADDLPLKRVMLSTGGVGYFEHEAVVQGDARISLDVRLDQVDDVLKSIVVYDDTGGVGTISLPGRDALGQVFRDLPFGRGALGSPVKLLNALQGASVEAVGDRQLKGRIIKAVAEKVRVGDNGETVVRHRVSLLTAVGVQQFVLEDAKSVSFTEPGLQAQVDRALAAIARHRVRDKRTLSISLKGTGKRTVRVAYVVGVPLWKSTYRLTLPADSAATTAKLQGWAVIENMTGQDWTSVELTLVSGNPVSFRQALYSSYYVNRPEVPVEVLGRILPKPDTGTLGRVAAKNGKGERRESAPPRARSSRAPGAGMVGGMMDRATAEMEAGAPPRMAAPAMLAESREAATQVLFRLPEPLSIESGHSLVVPIADRKIPARRVALYQPSTHATHPLAAVRLVNDGQSGLPPGVLTIYERTGATGDVAYVGDAQLTTLPAGGKRLVSFALDQKTQVGRTVDNRRRLAKGAIERGIFRRTVIERQTTTYRLKAPALENRTVLLEHPRRAGWTLVTPGKDDVELSDRTYRIAVTLKKGKSRVLEAVMERPRQETVQVLSISAKQIAAYAKAPALSEDVRNAFARMADLRRTVAAHRGEVKKLEGEHKTIVDDQARIRQNLKQVNRGSDLHNRYLKKLNIQEDRLESLFGALQDAKARVKAAEDALAGYVAKLKV
jgi:hypothetical protein